LTETVLSTGRHDVYRAVTDKIVAAIEAGTGGYILPWHRDGRTGGRPTNGVTTRSYQGINAVALWAEANLQQFCSNFWATYLQWQRVGAQVRRGESGTEIIFFKKLEPGERAESTEDEEEGQPRFVARAARVFNADQVDDWDDPDAFLQPECDVLEIAEGFVRRTGAVVRHGGDRAYYSPIEDVIAMPERRRFVGTPSSTPQESYYATLLHELTHWTGSSSRLNREFGRRFGDDAYAMEELVADLGGAFLCADLEITSEPRPDHAAYLASWLRVLKQDSRAIFTAARLANRACDYLDRLTSPALSGSH
jgi:antirestriction protein ArdC